MQKVQILLLPLLFAFFTAFSHTPPVGRPMAKPGQKVWVVAYYVQAKKRTQYEHFVHDIFWPGAAKLTSAQEKQVFRQTRILHPTKANPDGSYSYLYIMDPVIEGANYDIESLLVKMYGKAKGAEYGKLFGDSLVPGKKYDEYIVTQSKD